MEANFFRFLADELAVALTGQRIEKVHGPAEGVLILTMHGQGRTSHLIFRPAKSAGLLFASQQRPHNPPSASSRVMWLRKRLTGRRLLEARLDWPQQRLAFALSPRDVPGAGRWLVLDLRAELTLAEDFPVPAEPAWPPLEGILDQPDIWRLHPQLTPPLRKRLATLAATQPGQAAQLLQRLAAGKAGGFFLPQDGPPLAWDPGQQAQCQEFASAMEAARVFGERALFTSLALADTREGLDQAAQASKRLKRQLDLLDKDAQRHAALAALSRPAEALQIALSSMPATPQGQPLILVHPEYGPVEVPLEPRLSPVENMARLFGLAAKGRRGLEHVARRRAQFLAGVGPEALPASAQPQMPGTRPSPPAPVLTLPKKYQGLAVALFRTSDGFLVLRGKSSQANHQMLSRAASPHDYWLHAAGGPSAHVILRRDYPDQQVPEQSLIEAAGLCALKSWRKDDVKAEIMLARVKDVRTVKGAAMGSVAVDQVERMLLVPLDPTLEERLAVRG